MSLTIQAGARAQNIDGPLDESLPITWTRVVQPALRGFLFLPLAGRCLSGLMRARSVLLATWLSPETLLIKLFDLRSFIIG